MGDDRNVNFLPFNLITSFQATWNSNFSAYKKLNL